MNRLITALLIACFVIMALHATAFAQGAIDRDLASLRKVVKYQLSTKGRATGALTDSTVDYALNRASVQTCTRYPAIEKLDTLYLTRDSMGLGMAADFDRIKAVKKFAGDTVMSIVYKHPDSLPKEMGTWKIAKEPGDLRYFYTTGQRLMIWPKSTNYETDSILVEYYAQDAMLSSVTDSTAIHTKYIDKLVEYACMILSGTRHQWQDAAFYQAMFKDKPIPFEEIMNLK